MMANSWIFTLILQPRHPLIGECLNVFIELYFVAFRPGDFPVSYSNRNTSLEIVIHEVLWSIRGSYSLLWSLPLMNVKWHSDSWPTVTSQPIRLSTNFMTLISSLTFTELWVVSMEHLKRMWHASRERLPFWTPGSVPLVETCLCSNLWDF